MTADDPAGRRRHRLTTGIIASLGCRAVAAAVPFVLIPITLSALGVQLYGLWMAVTAVTAMAAFADLGLGNGLMTRLAPCYATGETGEARRLVTSAYATLGALALAALAVLWLAAPAVDWAGLFNVRDPQTAEHARGIATVCLSAFLVNIPLSLVYRVQYAYQQIAPANLWSAAGSVAAIPLVVLAVRLGLSPELVVLAAVLGPPLGNVAAGIWVFGRLLPQIAPSRHHLDRKTATTLLRLGGQFLVLTVVMSLATSADNLVVAHVLGLTAVTTFAVPARLFAQVGLLVTMVSLPLWPANGEALARGEVPWVRRVTRRMTFASTIVALVPSLVLVIAGDGLLRRWLGIDLEIRRELFAGLALWWLLLAALSPVFMVQNSVGLVGPQLVGWTFYLVVSVPLKWWAAGEYGLVAVPFVGVLAYACTVLPGAWWGYRRALSTAVATRRVPQVLV